MASAVAAICFFPFATANAQIQGGVSGGNLPPLGSTSAANQPAHPQTQAQQQAANPSAAATPAQTSTQTQTPPTVPAGILSGVMQSMNGINLSATSTAVAQNPSLPPSLSPQQQPADSTQAALEQQAEAEAAKASEDEANRLEKINHKAFNSASSGLLPLSPDQIRDFMRKFEDTQESAQIPFEGQPKGEVKVASLSLDPGGESPQINLAAGYVTTIDMVDQTGAPWPILDVGVGGNFEVTPTQAGSHVVRIVPLTRLGTGNLSILLKDLSTPVIFKLSSGGATFHMRYDARVPKLGPNARIPLISRGRTAPIAGDEAITMILENAPPKEAVRLRVSGLDARTMAWRLDNRFFVRTPLELLSPAWNASASSADGMTVYEIGDAPVLLMSDNGALVRARITRDEDHDK